MSAGHPDDAASVGIDRQAGVREEAHILAVAGRPQALHAAGMGLILEFGCILNGEHVPASRLRPGVAGGSVQHLPHRHFRAVDKATKADLAGMSAAKPPEAHRTLAPQRGQQIGPCFFAAPIAEIAKVRQSPCHADLPESELGRHLRNHTGFAQYKPNRY